MVVVRYRTPAFKLRAYASKSPVVQSLLTQMLNGLRLKNLYSLLPEPEYETAALFEIV